MAMPAWLNGFLSRLAARQELALVALLVLTMAMMIMPVPTAMADVLIAANIGLSLLLMMVAIHITAPVEFSTLPSIILITTAFRLSLSITTSRMVLVQGDAGEIIRTFGEFLIAGNVVVGLVVYLIITIVQFVVITKGSERVAEVAARFTLDALPGKQISIDTDLKNGDIDQKDARQRRRTLEKESQLYGAMDGAMKFVKGDAIASLVIIVVNLIGGMAIGCLQRGMSFPQAVQTYSLLAVGDGLIAQIPALLISLTAGVIVTRVTSDSGSNLGRDIMSQLTGHPRTLQISALVLAALAMVPGFPTAVFLTLAILLGAAGWALAGRAKTQAREFEVARGSAERAGPEAAALTVRLGPAWRASGDDLTERLDLARLDLGRVLGIRVPRVTVMLDDTAAAATWRLEVDGLPSGEGEVAHLEDLVPAVRAALGRVAGQFIGIQESQALLTSLEPDYVDLVREATKAAPLPRLAEVLRRLLDEQVSIANLRSLLEAVAEWGPRETNTAVLAEHVRIALRRQICFALAGPDKVLPVVLLEAQLDDACRAGIQATPVGLQLILDPAASERLLTVLRQMTAQRPASRARPAMLVSADLRRHLRALLHRSDVDLPVLTHGELAPDFRLDVVGTIRHAQVMAPSTARSGRETPHLVAVSG
ncbi:flagellar biosynthesis protein FlhA [Lichenihabitans psoromatis]|uniref:flagellar biosynthesis protein FlhA n=1 Tax=Lichenihabitans psoromatis TaxID=2528642 RepID=UPI00103844AD|nr:flagellar biosynthesis protein FlhA [Lichenihabitans psoromatis]